MDSPNSVTCYMCRIDWEDEIEHTITKVYPSIRALKRDHPMAAECGIVAVQVSLIEIIKEGTVY